jgi:hypothetical protein
MRSQPGSRASQSISYPSSSSTSSSYSYHHRGWGGFREVEDTAAVVVAAVGVEEAAVAVMLGAGASAVAVVEEDVGRRLSRRRLTYLLTCIGNRHPSPRLSHHLRDRRDSCQGSSSPGSRSRATPWTCCNSHSSLRDSLQVMNLPK